ncbi:hypothetical protein D3C80_1226430 [compost metagenome]
MPWPNSLNWAPNWATVSAEPRPLRRCSARARAWLRRAYSSEIASTMRVRSVASSIARLAIRLESMSRSAAIACRPASGSASWATLAASWAAPSSSARRST